MGGNHSVCMHYVCNVDASHVEVFIYHKPGTRLDLSGTLTVFTDACTTLSASLSLYIYYLYVYICM